MKHECENGAKRQCFETQAGFTNIYAEGVKNQSEESDDVIEAIEGCHCDVDDRKEDQLLLLMTTTTWDDVIHGTRCVDLEWNL